VDSLFFLANWDGARWVSQRVDSRDSDALAWESDLRLSRVDPHELLPEGQGQQLPSGLHRGQNLQKGNFLTLRHVLIKSGKVVLL
jgi:hypothetical protein